MSRVRKSGDKNQQILKALLKEPGNSHCADCKNASHPRWASWNLGIFICIRCSGIHRSMGTHISRVKSVDLDTWTNEQVESMVKWGNGKANQFWESKLPSHVPDDSKIENFIRTKYDLKKWAGGKQVPDPSSISSTNVSKTETTNEQSQSQSKNNLLDLEFGSPIAAPKTQSSPSRQSFPKPSSTLESLNFNQPNNVSVQQHSQHAQHAQHAQQPQQHQQRSLNQRPDLKKSILSLYSTPIASNSTPNFPPNNQNHMNGLQSQSTSNLNGLNFNSVPQVQQNVWNQPPQQPQQQYNNPLDDELFQNVWK